MDPVLRDTIIGAVAELATPDRPIYLVGGAVRDLLLSRPAHDMDFVLPGAALPVARAVANRLKGGLYVMDAERDIARVVLDEGTGGARVFLDFSTLRAGDLDGDLRARDFTINAMAVDVTRPDHLIDPTGGLADLRAGRIRACAEESLSNDPVRVLRAVRQALHFHFRIDPQTKAWIRAAVPLLERISAERIRDEVFRLLDGPQVALGLRLLEGFGALPYTLPELVGLKGVRQGPPHVHDTWEHTLSMVQHLQMLMAPLVGAYREESVGDLTVGSAVLWLGRFRAQFAAHFAEALVPDRSLRPLLFLAALYHDVSKPATRMEMPEGKVRFLDHPRLGARVAAERARQMALSVPEIERLETLVAEHMRVHFFSQVVLSGREINRRSIYRYFRATGAAGVEICLLSLADTRATYETALPPAVWEAELTTCRTLLEAYWERGPELVAPPRLLSGHDVMEELHLPAGQMIGKILEAVREAQAAGEVTTRDQALAFAQAFLSSGDAMTVTGDTPEGD